MFKKFIPQLIAIAGFVLVSFIYASPLLQGKRLAMHDTQMAAASAKEVNDFHSQTGEWAWWTNSMFGGMPSYMVAGDYENSLSTKIGSFYMNLIPSPANVLILLMLGFFVLMRVLKVNHWLAFFGSVAYAFNTYSLLFIEAGHISKIIAVAFAPAVLASFIAVFRGRYLLGIAMTTFFMAMEFYANHPQITYYLFFLLGIYVLFESYLHVKKGNFSGLLKAYAIVLVGSLIGIGTHGMHLWNNFVYSKETTRGKSELTLGNLNQSADGLGRDYAFSYSPGKIESLTLLAPNFVGGTSAGNLGEKSETYKMLINKGVDASMALQFSSNLPLYFGPQGSTSGPNYSGIVILFLFVLGMIILRDGLRYVLLLTAILYLFIGWGSSFSGFNFFMFDYFPYYNKFRDSKMIVTLLHLCFVMGGMLGIKKIMDDKLTFNDLKKPLIYSLGSILLVILVGYFSLDFQAVTDAAMLKDMAQSNGQDFANAFSASIIADRQSAVMSDLLRSVFLLMLSAGLIWAYTTQKIKTNVFVAVLGLLSILDLILVDKRYFNNDDYQPKSRVAQSFTPSPANEQILQDKDPDFRVVDMATNQGFFADATASYFHKSVGGYHGAKLKRIQELYDNAMTKDGKYNIPIFNMLNTKYFITPTQDGGVAAQRNPDALGNAWFVNEVKIVKNADEEIKSVGNFNPRMVAFVDQRFEPYLKEKPIKQDTTASIKLTEYKPNFLSYESNSASNQVAIFSEIYYRGNEDWKSYVDGQETPHFRANYVLRAMVVPAGKHKIEFKFQPKSVVIGAKIDLFASIAMVLLVIGALVIELRGGKK
ncbi:YfhO family protein [Emticicia sp. SJ17W-69]|uniref:YfhO family protein n=1 Tax=Emticicia sp. SJ17W-69 TaxID=3421657 RepID=UPI003EB7C849